MQQKYWKIEGKRVEQPWFLLGTANSYTQQKMSALPG
jgi:hypothetical protein